MRAHRIARFIGATTMVSTLIWRIPALTAPVPAHASGTCAPVASPAANVTPSGAFDTAAHVIATFDSARQAEGCTVPLSINATAYDSATPQQQMLMLFNAERQDRGLGTLQLDTTLMSQIDLNHSREMAQYNYFNHPSPINEPPGTYGIFNRLIVNPAINGHWSNVGENIAAGQSTAAEAVYDYMYYDSLSSWGHRHNILGYGCTTATPPVCSFGAYNWVGIGIAPGISGTSKYSVYYTSDFLQGAGYTPPAATDTQAPTLKPPVITAGAAGGTVTAQVTNVADTGASTGAAGVTGVVFYANTPVDSSGNITSVIATQSAAGTWTAQLSLPVGASLHAVAVDGSGNYTDCVSTATSCGSAGSAPPSISLAKGWNLIDVYGQTATLVTASALITSLNAALGSSAIGVLATYANGRYALYVPGYSPDQSLQPSQGIFVNSGAAGSWTPGGTLYAAGQAVALKRGWNLVAAPFPVGGLTPSTISSEATGCGVQEIATYAGGSYSTWVPGTGGSLTTVPSTAGMWIECSSPITWTPS